MATNSSAWTIWRQVSLTALAAILLAACAPGLSPEQVQLQVQTGVAQTIEAQNGMATSVAMTVAALVPTVTPTPSPTEIPLDIPTLTPVIPIATVTPFVSAAGGGGGGGSSSKPKYACDVQTRPYDNTAFKPGDPFDIKWTITNTGTAVWEAGKDLDYYSGPQMTTRGGVELPEMDPGDTYSFTADANAPEEKGFHVMTWKVEGGFCRPYVAIYSGK